MDKIVLLNLLNLPNLPVLLIKNGKQSDERWTSDNDRNFRTGLAESARRVGQIFASPGTISEQSRSIDQREPFRPFGWVYVKWLTANQFKLVFLFRFRQVLWPRLAALATVCTVCRKEIELCNRRWWDIEFLLKDWPLPPSSVECFIISYEPNKSDFLILSSQQMQSCLPRISFSELFFRRMRKHCSTSTWRN